MRFYVVAGIPETAGYFEEVRPRPEQMLKKEFREEDAELFILNNMLSKKYDQNLDLLVESGPIISYPVIDDGHKWFEMGKKVRYYISVDCWYGNERQVWYFDPETGKHVAIHNWGEQFGRIEGLREGLSQGEKVQIYEVGKWHQWRVRDAQQVLEIPKNLEPVILRAYRWMGRAFKDKNDGSIYTAIYGHYIRFDISENLLQNLVTSSASKQVE